MSKTKRDSNQQLKKKEARKKEEAEAEHFAQDIQALNKKTWDKGDDF